MMENTIVNMVENIEVPIHSSIVINHNGMKIYVDPYKIKNENHDADFILITHNHYDHFSMEDIKKIIKNDTKIIYPASIENDIKKNSLNNGIAVKAYDEKELATNIKITAIPAYNIAKPFHPKFNNWLGYLLNIDGTTIYVVGDSDLTKEAQNIKCDILMCPIGGTYTMNAIEAAKLTNIIMPKCAIPVHYGDIVGTHKDFEEFKQDVDKNVNVVEKISLER